MTELLPYQLGNLVLGGLRGEFSQTCKFFFLTLHKSDTLVERYWKTFKQKICNVGRIPLDRIGQVGDDVAIN